MNRVFGWVWFLVLVAVAVALFVVLPFPGKEAILYKVGALLAGIWAYLVLGFGIIIVGPWTLGFFAPIGVLTLIEYARPHSKGPGEGKMLLLGSGFSLITAVLWLGIVPWLVQSNEKLFSLWKEGGWGPTFEGGALGWGIYAGVFFFFTYSVVTRICYDNS